MKFWSLYSAIALLCILHVATCLRVNIHVPAHAISKSTAHLECTFELENEKQIDFVKMLKNNRLFYVFVPKGDDQIFSVSGIDANDVEVTKSIGVKSGQILFRLHRIDPLSSGSYACEVQTKDPALRYTSVKEMIVPDPAVQKEKILTHLPLEKENIIVEPPLQKHNETANPNASHQGSETSAVAIATCAFLALSINYVARVVSFLK